MSSVIRGEDVFETSAGGIVLQTRYTVFDQWADFPLTANTHYNMNFLAVNIVPKSAKSVFKLDLALCFEASIVQSNIMFSATRNNVYIYNLLNMSNQNSGIAAFDKSVSNNAESTMDMAFYSYIDAPNTTGPITYTPTMRSQDDFSIAVNRTWANRNEKDFETGLSTFIVTELSGT